jgi:hypothetical protein
LQAPGALEKIGGVAGITGGLIGALSNIKRNPLTPMPPAGGYSPEDAMAWNQQG